MFLSGEGNASITPRIFKQVLGIFKEIVLTLST